MKHVGIGVDGMTGDATAGMNLSANRPGIAMLMPPLAGRNLELALKHVGKVLTGFEATGIGDLGNGLIALK